MKAKNTQNSARWSPFRVGVSVMNSRSAQNETSPNNTTVAVVPSQNAAASTVQSTHQPRIRRLKVRTAAGSRPRSGCRLRNWPTTVAPVSNASTPVIRAMVRMSFMNAAIP